MGRKDASVVAVSEQITGKLTTNYDKAKAIHNWVHTNIEYKRNPLVIPPWTLIEKGGGGDCKSFAVLTASLLGIAGIPCWLKLIKINGLEILHIYDIAKISWDAVDSVGARAFSEASPISGYILYEIDKTTDWPPKPLPSGSAISPEPEIKKAFPWIILGIGATALPFLALLKSAKKEREEYRPWEKKIKLPE